VVNATGIQPTRPFHLLHARPEHSIDKMALGNLFKQKPTIVADAPPLPNAPELEKPMVGNEGYAGQPSGYDPEKTGPRGMKMNRIDGSMTKSSSQQGDLSDDSSGMSVGKQMEMEAGNAIKYRTCSWPKV
jgi:hypothetical protein